MAYNKLSLWTNGIKETSFSNLKKLLLKPNPETYNIDLDLNPSSAVIKQFSFCPMMRPLLFSP